MAWGNCLVYALLQCRKKLREWQASGHPVDRVPCILLRPSRLAPRWVPHWVVGWWHPQTGAVLEVESFEPDDKSPLRWWQVWRALWFRGRVRQGDAP